MITEFRKSIQSILYQRVTSPLFGTLILSWLICNWKIWYLTIFIDQDRIPKNKIDFILDNYVQIDSLVVYPLISTLMLLTAIPFLSNWAYWLDLKFKVWRVDQKTKMEGKQLLTLEKSLALRNEIREQEDRFDKLLERKNEEIESLKKQIEQSQKPIASPTTSNGAKKTSTKRTELGGDYSNADYNLLHDNKEAYNVFETVVKAIQSDKQFPSSVSDRVKEFYLVNEIVQELDYIDGGHYYDLTFKGRRLYKDYFNLNLAKEK